jgi:hypothetical protein
MVSTKLAQNAAAVERSTTAQAGSHRLSVIETLAFSSNMRVHRGGRQRARPPERSRTLAIRALPFRGEGYFGLAME